MEQKGLNIAAIPLTAIRVLTSPSSFFREMPKTGGFVEPLIFAVAMGVVGGLIHAVLNILGLKLGAGIAAGFAAIFIVPIMVAIVGFIGAAILFVIWKLMGSQESYETAYRCGAYMSAVTPITTVLGIVPYLGGPAGILIGAFFIVIASIEVHNIPSQKAWLVFGIIAAVLVVLSLGGEFAGRRISRNAEQFKKEMEKASEEMKKQAEEMQKKGEQLQKQTDKAQQDAEEMQKKMENMQKMSPEEARKAAEEMMKQQQKQQDR